MNTRPTAIDTELLELADEIRTLRASLLAAERARAASLADRDAESLPSLRNLIHYLALRRRDVRVLQERLARVGLSSLGRCEAHVLGSVDAVLSILERITESGCPRAPASVSPFDAGYARLDANTRALLGPRPNERRVRIMVTLSSEAAADPSFARELVAAGTNLVRINCAHDDPDTWSQMIDHVRSASASLGSPCLVAMDLAGPKLRTCDVAGAVPLASGDRLLLVANAGAPDGIPQVACSIPAVLDDVRAGEPVWFDDGKLGGVIDAVDQDGVHVRITYARGGRVELTSDRGINFPESVLHVAGLTARDREDLAFVARRADIAALSFAQRHEDVTAICERLAELGAPRLGIVLKIETRLGFERLPNLLLHDVGAHPLGIMIARGDLALEVGYERLAEVQEEMLWICEAAHVPVIWATQVLERLAKDGMPTRAEVTDAAMAERAECVMLNKGKHVLEAVRVLDDILRRMESHQQKKRATFRALHVSSDLPSA
jgi:pyruvate kinase